MLPIPGYGTAVLIKNKTERTIDINKQYQSRNTTERDIRNQY